MLAGVFLRHFKIYQGLYFVPICTDYSNRFSLYIGNNGVGKSSILESLNTFFNNGNWNKHKDGKRDEAFIAPLFLVDKDEFNQKYHDDTQLIDYIEFLSNYFWDSTSEIHTSMSSNEFKRFFAFRDELKKRYDKDKYYFFLVGIQYESRSNIFFITFNQDLERKVPQSLGTFNANKLLDVIREFHTYIYIPIEAIPSEVLRIENREMQELMNKDILNEIDVILNQKNIVDGKRTTSVIDFLNSSLNKYMDSINDIIGKIDERYAFKVEGIYKKNLTSSDVRKKILEAYFSIRTLKKDRKEVSELSSGEQRIALIDIATAFLLENTNADKNIIIAIDEPENSLHISKAFGQFERLQKLSEHNQIILTTHWYGSLPITNAGDLHHIEVDDKRIDVRSYKLNNYFEKRGQLPSDIIIKSYFELTSSIISSMRADKLNWIICEGSDDKLYFEYYLRDIPNLKVFTVGGCGNVVKLYNYLYVPLSEKDESKALASKVLCLVDTDDVLNVIDLPSETKSNNLKIARIQLNNNIVTLAKLSTGGVFKPTEIEDCLDPKILFNALKETVNTYGDMEQRDAIGLFSFNENAVVSRIKGEESILKPDSLEALDKKKYIYSFIDDYRNKYLLAETYVKFAEQAANERAVKEPQLFEAIREYFNKA
jgi:predicted ATPase